MYCSRYVLCTVAWTRADIDAVATMDVIIKNINNGQVPTASVGLGCVAVCPFPHLLLHLPLTLVMFSLSASSPFGQQANTSILRSCPRLKHSSFPANGRRLLQGISRQLVRRWKTRSLSRFGRIFCADFVSAITNGLAVTVFVYLPYQLPCSFW